MCANVQSVLEESGMIAAGVQPSPDGHLNYRTGNGDPVPGLFIEAVSTRLKRPLMQGSTRASYRYRFTGALNMTSTEEQQALASLAEISRDIKELLALLKDSARKQGEADEKAYGQLVNIAHKR
jgi:hypothetical protein